MTNNQLILESIADIKLSMIIPAMCDRLISVSKSLDQSSDKLSSAMRTQLAVEFGRLTDELWSRSPTLLDPVPLITLVSTIPMSIQNANRIACHISTISFHEDQELIVGQLVHALVENLRRFETIQFEMATNQAKNPRFHGAESLEMTNYESYLLTIAYELCSINYTENYAREYLDYVFSLDIRSNDASMDPKGATIAAMLGVGNEKPEKAAPAWPEIKRWLHENQSLVTERLLASGWHTDFKPRLADNAERLGLPWLSVLMIKRGYRVYETDFLELQTKHGTAPDQGTYSIAFNGPDGEPAPVNDKTLTAMFAHALVYENVMPDTWITDPNSSALRLLNKAMGVLKSNRLQADPERLKDLFDLCSRKLRNDKELGWLDGSDFDHLLGGSLGLKGVKFSQELGL